MVTQGARAGEGAVGQDGDSPAFADPDDLMGAGCGQIVGAARQGGRDPQHLASRVRDDLDVRPVSAVLGRVVGTTVADAVALCKRPAEEDEVGVMLAQGLQ